MEIRATIILPHYLAWLLLLIWKTKQSNQNRANHANVTRACELAFVKNFWFFSTLSWVYWIESVVCLCKRHEYTKGHGHISMQLTLMLSSFIKEYNPTKQKWIRFPFVFFLSFSFSLSISLCLSIPLFNVSHVAPWLWLKSQCYFCSWRHRCR